MHLFFFASSLCCACPEVNLNALSLQSLGSPRGPSAHARQAHRRELTFSKDHAATAAAQNLAPPHLQPRLFTFEEWLVASRDPSANMSTIASKVRTICFCSPCVHCVACSGFVAVAALACRHWDSIITWTIMLTLLCHRTFTTSWVWITSSPPPLLLQ